jgi:hypothetical protein
MYKANGMVFEAAGQHYLHWLGQDVPVPKEEAAILAAQTTLRLRTAQLEDGPLNWACAEALGYTPRLQGEVVPGKLLGSGGPGEHRIQPEHHGYYVVAYYSRTHYGEFRPASDVTQSSPLIDSQRISTEVAGDGWAALVNDCFGPGTWAKSVKAPTRVLAALRALVQHKLGDEVEVPVELLSPAIRLEAARRSAAHDAPLESLREFVRQDGPTAHYPVPTKLVRWLLAQYHKLPYAMPAPASRRYQPVPFPTLSSEDKLVMVYREVEGANSSGLPEPTVPASWVTWLLGEHDRLARCRAST